MLPSFLPAAANALREPAAVALAQSIERQNIFTPLSQQAIATTYVCQGSGGIPILLLHGFDSSVLEFRHLLPLLAAHRETWTVDLLGSGFTARLPGLPYSPAAIKTHLYEFWKTLIDRPVILVGASMGGATAIDFALTHPQAVQSLVLINSVGYSGSFPMGRFLFPPLDFLAVEWWRLRKVQPLAWAITLGYWNAATVEALRCATLHLEMPRWHDAIDAFTKSGGYSDLAVKIPQLKKPTLILWGEFDDVLGTKDAARFNQAIVGSKLIWLRCGHVPQIEQPQTLAQHILAFQNNSA